MLFKLLQNLFPKGNIVIKRVPDLTPSEREQIQQIIQRYYPTATLEYIEARTKIDNGFDLVMIQEQGIIQGVSYYSIRAVQTPFAEQPIPVVHFGQAMKREGYKGDVIWRLGINYAAKLLGWSFPLQKAMGISTIVSPRVYEKFQQLYPHTFEIETHPCAHTALQFMNTYFQVERGLNVQVDQEQCYSYANIAVDDITEDWERFYKAKNPAINQLFFKKGILVEQNGRIYKTAKHLVACGYRDVWQGHNLTIKKTKPALGNPVVEACCNTGLSYKKTRQQTRHQNS